jgi:hypothetical protein
MIIIIFNVFLSKKINQCSGAPVHFAMAHSDSLVMISDDDDDDPEPCLYIDESTCDTMVDARFQQTKSTNTGNPFELDWIVAVNIHRYQTRSCQTTLTSHGIQAVQRHRSTVCQPEYFHTSTRETNTDRSSEDRHEPRIAVMAQEKADAVDALSAS